MLYLMVAGIVASIFGLALLLAPAALKGFSAVVDRVVLVVDEYFRPRQKPAGIVLLLVGAWLLMVNIVYHELSLLLPIWMISIFFGLLFVAFPDLLRSISAVADSKLLDTDDYVRRSSRFIGILTLLAGLYMIAIAFTLK